MGDVRRIRWAMVVAALSMLLLHVPGMASPAGGQRGASATAERYIVVLHDGVDPDSAAADHRRSHGARVEFVYRHALSGYSARMSPQAAERITNDRRVASVERDQLVYANEQTMPTGVDRVATPDAIAGEVPHLTIDGTDDKRVDVDVAVIDTGIDDSHPQLNVVGGVDCAGGSPWKGSCKEVLPGDGDGHGTHVAGTIGAIDDGSGVVGVAPGARLWAVKVLRDDGSGYMSWIAAGIDWVTANGGKNGPISVANMSLGCQCTSSALDTALTNSVAAGVVHVVAAGNSDLDLRTNAYSPAKHDDVITVSALSDANGRSGGGTDAPACWTSQGDDVPATFTNFDSSGDVIDITAPGVCILSTVPGGGYASYNGTSMASPHVAGAAALLTSQKHPLFSDDVDVVRNTLVTNGNDGWTEAKDDVPERLLDVSNTTVFTPKTITVSDGGGGGNSSPTASFTYSCTDLSCSFDGSGSSDSGGSISEYSWDFGDGATATGQVVNHSYAAGGSYTVTLTVTDNEGATGEDSQSVTVSEPSTSGITLTATGYKVKGRHQVDLTWSGTEPGGDVQVSEGGGVVMTTADDGSATYSTDRVGGGSFTYTVCEPGQNACSNEVTVTF